MKYLQKLMNLFLPNCEQISNLTSQALDETVTLKQKIQMKTHLVFCEFCRNNARQLQLIRTMIQKKKSSKETNNQTLSSTAKQRINDILNSSDSKE